MASNIITKYRNQKKNYNEYSNKCATYKHHCKSDRSEWDSGVYKCKSNVQADQAVCSKLNPSVCWNKEEDITNTTLKNTLALEPIWSPTRTNDSDSSIQCNYDTSKINTLDKVKAYEDLYEEDDPDLFNIQTNYCSQLSRNCLQNGGDDVDFCSNIQDNGFIGDYCRQWFSKFKETDEDHTTRDSIIRKVCGTNPTIKECECANRQSNDIYRSVNNTKSINDGCWWLPCKNPGVNLIPSDVYKPVCPDKICETSIKVDNIVGDVTIDDIKNYISCSPPSPPDDPSGNKKTKKIIIISSISVGALIFIGIIVYIIYKKVLK